MKILSLIVAFAFIAGANFAEARKKSMMGKMKLGKTTVAAQLQVLDAARLAVDQEIGCFEVGAYLGIGKDVVEDKQDALSVGLSGRVNFKMNKLMRKMKMKMHRGSMAGKMMKKLVPAVGVNGELAIDGNQISVVPFAALDVMLNRKISAEARVEVPVAIDDIAYDGVRAVVGVSYSF